MLRYSQAKTQRHATKCRQGHIGIPFLVGLITKSNGSEVGVLSGIRRLWLLCILMRTVPVELRDAHRILSVPIRPQ